MNDIRTNDVTSTYRRGLLEVKRLSINMGLSPQGQMMAQQRVAVPGTRLFVVPGERAIVEVTDPTNPRKVSIGEFPFGQYGWEYEVLETSQMNNP